MSLIETAGNQDSLRMELENACTKVQVFPQLVQGKRGENWGESQKSGNIFVLCLLMIFNFEN